MKKKMVGGRSALLAFTTLLAPGALLAAPIVAAAPQSAPKAPPISAEVGSYDVGLMLGGQLDHNGMAKSVSVDELIRGLREGISGHAMSAEQRDAALQFMREARDALADKNRALAKQFLEHNSKEPGIETMPSGLQYRVLAAGDASAKSPLPTDQVTVRYRASLADGTEFDRSDTHDRAATFRVNSVFKGWQQAFLAMKPGAKWQLFVPPELGYGNNSPPMVPPGALLIYDLELLKVEPSAPMDAAKKQPGERVRPAPPPAK
jgi:FKBP-type peptidyl-prolyl cis-trans isomerase FklB